MAVTAAMRREQMIRVYVDEHGFAVIVVTAKGRLDVQTSFDWRDDHRAIWWLADEVRARELVAGIPADGDPDDTIRLVLLGAERSRVKLTDHATLLARAAGAIDLVESRLVDLQGSGGLKALNTEYQDRRLYEKEQGRNFEPYQPWLHRKKIEMVKAVARTAAGRKPAGQTNRSAGR
jgi:hypothetical protein